MNQLESSNEPKISLNWKVIWDKRNYSMLGKLDLATLIKLNGFDSGAGKIALDDWRLYTQEIAKKLAIVDGASIYEIGCGAGAFLFALLEGHQLKVGGLDYASALITYAKQAMSHGDFTVAEAKSIETETQYDFVISNSVFHYFSEEYAENVLEKMIKKSKLGVLVLDVPDMATKTQCENFRRNMLTQEEYEKKYAGLEHTYYHRNWFHQQANRFHCQCETFDGCVPNYAQNKFRFNVLIKK